MKHYAIFSLIVVVLLCSLVSCGSKTPIPAGLLPTHTELAADDIIPTPGGGTYRANVTEAGQKNPFEPVKVGMNTWTVGKETVAVLYRSDIKAKAGEAYTDIVTVSGMAMMDRAKNKLVLYAEAVPKGITVTDAEYAAGLPGTLGTVLVITMSPDITDGTYTVKIGIELDGKDYGTVPCLVTVTK
jgi:hypothetical protein